MLLRSPPLLAFALLLAASATAADAKPRSTAIADLNLRQPISSQLINKVRADLSLSGYTLNEKAAFLRELQGAMVLKPGLAEAAMHLRNAQESYEEFKLERALAGLQTVDSILFDAASGDKERKLLAQRYLLAGLIRVAQSQRDKAINDFRLAHRLKPSLEQLDAGSHRPSVVTLYADAVRQNRNAKAAKLVRAWEPSAAQLYVDGLLLGKSGKVTQGPHILSLQADGYQGKSLALSLAAATTHKVELVQLTQAQRLRTLRIAAATGEQDDTSNLSRLADLVAVDTLVLVRGGSQGPSAALYDRGSASLSAWVQIGSVRWQSLLTPEESGGGAMKLEVARQDTPTHPWFRQWWGGGLIVGGTALVGTAIYFALSAGDSANSEATIDQWCFGSCN